MHGEYLLPPLPPEIHPTNEFISFYEIHLRLTASCGISFALASFLAPSSLAGREFFWDHVVLGEMTFDGRAQGVTRINNPTAAISFRAQKRGSTKEAGKPLEKKTNTQRELSFGEE